MAVLDTLEILIEADRSGLESQLKRAGNSIQQFVNSMNKQEVSWTQILSKSITPALIAGIASTFAIAVTQALQFQNAMQTSSLSAKDSFADNTAEMSDSVYDLSSSTGKSANDIATALGIIQGVYKDTSTAQGMLNVITQEAAIRHMSVADAAKLLIPLFQQWGITDVPTASNAMATMNDAVKQGNISFTDLISTLTDVGPELKNVASLGDTAMQAEMASNLTDSATALDMLKVAAETIKNPIGEAAALFGQLGATIKTQGLSAAFADIATKIQGAGGAAEAIYGQFFSAANSIEHLKEVSVPALAAVGQSAKDAEAKTKSLNQQWLDNQTVTDKLSIAWQTFVNALQKFIIPGALKELTGLLEMMGSALDYINGITKDGFLKTLSDTMAGLKDEGFGQFLTDLSDNMAKIPGMKFLAPGLGAGQGGQPVQNGGGTSNVTNNVTQNINMNAPAGGEGQSANSLMDLLKNATHQ